MKHRRKFKIPIFQVDAFTDEPFKGNPAAVCILPRRFKDRILQAIAAEMNLSETAFLFPLEDKPLEKSEIFSLRWFTPTVEVPLCGHATLATAAVLFYQIEVLTNKVNFATKSGKLTARKDQKGIILDFPVHKPAPIKPPINILKALQIHKFKKVLYEDTMKVILIHLFDAKDVTNLVPNFEEMKSINKSMGFLGVIVTARGQRPYDFISRFFAPWVGVNEDPVTGVAHTILAPYWSKILGKDEMLCYQASSRGGELVVRLLTNKRVNLIGKAVIVFKGELYL